CVIRGDVRLKEKIRTESKASFEIAEEKDADGQGKHAVVRYQVDEFKLKFEPFKEQEAANRKEPNGSGGLLAAMYVYDRLLTQGTKGCESECDHGAQEPFYPPRLDGAMPNSLKELRVDAEVLLTRLGVYQTKWFFALADQKLLGFELRVADNEDPCEV